MMTVEQIEGACDAAQVLDFSRHEVEGPELTLSGTFYPFGFPVEVITNSAEILVEAEGLWGMFKPKFATPPIRIEVQVNESDEVECPPSPSYRLLWPLLMCVADQGNYSVYDLERCETKMVITRNTERHKLYLRSIILGGAAGCHIATKYATPVHAACVALDGHGVMLCGDSGAGKSSLSYACARAGWTFVTDDCSFLVHGDSGKTVIGNCYQIRFRPSAGELFPEIDGLEITPRLIGKPSIELPTGPMPHMICSPSEEIEFIVFLNRRSGGPAELVRYRKDVARNYMRQTLYGAAESLAVQYESIERLLELDVFELRYTDLDWAISRLQALVREGR